MPYQADRGAPYQVHWGAQAHRGPQVHGDVLANPGGLCTRSNDQHGELDVAALGGDKMHRDANVADLVPGGQRAERNPAVMPTQPSRTTIMILLSTPLMYSDTPRRIAPNWLQQGGRRC
jgi:hypothetical protein